MAQLYFGLFPDGTVADVFVNSLVNWNDNWHPTCKPDLTSDGFLVHNTNVSYVNDFTNGKPLTFRHIDWSNRLAELEDFLTTTDKKVWIGSYIPEQMEIIKNHFQGDVTTVALNYDNELQSFLLEMTVPYYNLDEIKDFTDEAKFIFTWNKYNSNQAVWNERVPPELNIHADINVRIEDFFHPPRFIKIMDEIDGPRNIDQMDYYLRWLYRVRNRL